MKRSILPPGPRTEGQSEAALPAPLTAVLADDNQPFRHAVTQLLADHYGDLLHVLAVCRSDEVEAVCAHQQPQVVLLDIGLPGMANLSRIAGLRSTCAAEVIVLSMEDEPPYVEAACIAGARALLGKASLNSTLRQTVLASLAK